MVIFSWHLLSKESSNHFPFHKFNSNFQILKSISKLKLNEVIGEKLIDVLLHTCGQLILNSPKEVLNTINQTPLHLIYYFDELTLEQMNSICTKKGGNDSLLANKFSLLISNVLKKSEYLFYYIIICLDLFIRFNDGCNNCVFASGSKTNSLYILNEFCDILFNKSNDGNHFITY